MAGSQNDNISMVYIYILQLGDNPYSGSCVIYKRCSDIVCVEAWKVIGDNGPNATRGLRPIALHRPYPCKYIHSN
jgi:hypothetical protein